ncbi:energy transducer TonB [Acinetobacter puyangensis]|uniref:energy transducer TonB n=1 Tax=Acinetobacter puyangensis TaxID=1096779 RepID=UPI003A4E4981
MSEIGLNHSKRALLYHQVATPHSHDDIKAIDPFAGQQNHHVGPPHQHRGKKLLLVAAIIAALHFSIWYVAKQLPTPPLQEKQPTPVVIEIVKPEPKEEPPKVIEPKIPPVVQKPKVPPVVEKPQPVKKVVEQPKPVQKSTPQSVAKPVEQPQPIVQPQPTLTENVRPTPAPTPTPAPNPAPQPVAENLPVTEAKGYAGYLSNPAPEYPEIALDRGWEGSVILRVKVSPSGSPVTVNVKQGSGRKVLDDAAVRTVKRWKFSPAMRGSTAIEGWVDVPINYQLPR